MVEAPNTPSFHPCVVLLEDGETVEVDIVVLPVTADVGTEFRWHGGAWRVAAKRPRNRVLVAAPVEPRARN